MLKKKEAKIKNGQIWRQNSSVLDIKLLRKIGTKSRKIGTVGDLRDCSSYRDGWHLCKRLHFSPVNVWFAVCTNRSGSLSRDKSGADSNLTLWCGSGESKMEERNTAKELDVWISRLEECKQLDESQVRILCNKVSHCVQPLYFCWL